MKPTHVATLLIAALLSASYFLSIPVAADPISAADAPPATPDSASPRIHVYLFRGFAGMVFSRGTDKLAEELDQAGFTTTVNEAVMCPIVAKDAISDYRTDPVRIAVIGHSVGAACALTFADYLNAENIPVSLVVTTDPAKISEDVPPNVERYINVFQSNSLLGGREVKAAKDFHGHFASYDIVGHKEITHVNMEKNEAIHQQLLNKIKQLAATPAKSEGENVPLHYTVPADAEIELWDSGTPIFTRRGDTLKSLASLYHVPQWSLEQINTVSKTAPLSPGQRIVVPRYLVTLPTLDGGAAGGEAQLKH
jgi:LysM repeat protein